MINYLKKILKNEDYNRIISNILSLFSLKGLTYILPLITFPYLTRVLGPDNYGILAFALSFIGYFQILTDYGFNLSATREISIHRKDHVKITKIFSSVMVTKLLLTILSFVLMILIVFSFSKFQENWLLYFFTFGLVIGNLLMPSWFFQGIEKIKYISLLNMGIAIIYTASIFIFIKSSSDLIYVPLINSIGSIVIGITALIIIRQRFNIHFVFPSMKDIIYQMKVGWHIFISTIAISFYSTSNVFVLGFFASPVIVGYYSVAENITKMVMGLLGPLSQSIYPYTSSLATKSKEETVKFIKKITILIGSSTFIISVLMFSTSSFIINILAGNQFSNSIPLLQIMSFLPFIVGLSTVFGVLFLFALGYSKRVSRVQFLIGICYPLLLIPMAYYLNDVGTAFSFLIVETVITVAFWKIYRNVLNEMRIC